MNLHLACFWCLPSWRRRFRRRPRSRRPKTIPHRNRTSRLGREAAAEVRKQYPLINESQITGYLERLGDRLVDASPAELKKPAFQYSFTPVNLKDINAFALPGGPMFVNRGMIEAHRRRRKSPA